MNETTVIQGRRIGAAELDQVKGILAAQPGWSRWRVSVELARLWNWRTATGQLKDMAARTLLLKLEQRGWIALPAPRRASPNRMRHKQMPVLVQPVCESPLIGPLAGLLPLRLTEVSGSGDRALFEVLLHRHHYLSHRSPVGENLQYLARERGGGGWRACSLARRPGNARIGTGGLVGTRPPARRSSHSSPTTRAF